MTTDFSYNNSTISTTGGFRPNERNVPLDSRTIVNNKADISSIPVPFIGMEITVLQDETKGNKMTVYKVTALNEHNAIDINTGIEDVTVPTKTSDLTNDSTFVTNSEMQEAIANISSSGSIDLSSYQPIADSSLQTTSKTVPGAINEINSSLNNKVETSDLGNAISSYVSENKAELKGDKGDKGEAGADGLTTSIFVNGNTYTHVSGTITLPNYPNVPTKTSDLTNDSGFLTSIPSEYVTEEEMNTALSTKANISHTHTEYASIEHVHNYNDLTSKPTIPSLEGYATETFVTTKITEAQLGGGEGLTPEQSSQLTAAYTHSQTPHVSADSIPTNVSDLTNDRGYVTESSMNQAINENKIYKITTAEYNRLSEAEKNGKLFVLTDYEEEQFSLSYHNNVLSLLKGNVVISQVTINSTSDSGGTTDVYGNIILSKSNTSIAKGESDTFTVKLDKAPTNTQTVTLTSVSPEINLSTTSLTFTSDNYNVEQTVTVTINAETTLTNGSISIISPNVESKSIVITINNPTVEEVFGNIVLSKTSATIVKGESDTFTVKLDKAPTNTQTVTLTSDTTGVTLSPNSLTFTSENYNVEQTVTVNVSSDTSATSAIITSSTNGTNKTINISIAESAVTPTTFTITNNLTNVANMNESVTTVNRNESYNAMLRPTINYVIENVTVTMGGVDVTSDVYSDASINITAVTGNIVISATGKVANVTVSGGTLIHSYDLSQAAENGTYIDTVGGWNLNSNKKVSRSQSLPNVDRFASFSIVINCDFNSQYNHDIFNTGPDGGFNITTSNYNTLGGRLILTRDISYGGKMGKLYIKKYYKIDNDSAIENTNINANIPKDTNTTIILISDANTNTTKIYVGGFLAYTLNQKSNLDGLCVDGNVNNASIQIYSGVVEVGV